MKKLVVFSLCLVFLCMASGLHGASKSITFKNTGTRRGNRLLFVELVAGDCKSPAAARMNTTVNPGGQRDILIPGGADSACWIISTHQNISQFPLHCGDAKAGETITISSGSKACDLVMLETDNVMTMRTALISPGGLHLEYSLTSWNDPLTAPHTATNCIGSASGHWPWCDNWSTCNQWATQCQFLRNEAFLVIDATSVTMSDLKTLVDGCLQKSACAAALAGLTAVVVTGGGALAAAEQAFTDVLVACLADAVQGVSVTVDIRSHWTPWGSCS